MKSFKEFLVESPHGMIKTIYDYVATHENTSIPSRMVLHLAYLCAVAERLENFNAEELKKQTNEQTFVWIRRLEKHVVNDMSLKHVIDRKVRMFNDMPHAEKISLLNDTMRKFL